jgi:hypothetical protein
VFLCPRQCLNLFIPCPLLTQSPISYSGILLHLLPRAQVGFHDHTKSLQCVYRYEKWNFRSHRTTVCICRMTAEKTEIKKQNHDACRLKICPWKKETRNRLFLHYARSHSRSRWFICLFSFSHSMTWLFAPNWVAANASRHQVQVSLPHRSG